MKKRFSFAGIKKLYIPISADEITIIQPRTDIITNSSDIWRYKTLDEGYDADNDSPFIYECVDSKDNAVVYSSKIGQAGIGDVFCFNISKEIDEYFETVNGRAKMPGQFGVGEEDCNCRCILTFNRY